MKWLAALALLAGVAAVPGWGAAAYRGADAAAGLTPEPSGGFAPARPATWWADVERGTSGDVAEGSSLRVPAHVGLDAAVARIRYTVAPGDTLARIAANYDISIRDIRRWNNLRSDSISVGQVLVLEVRGRAGDRTRTTHRVESGQTGMSIARRYGVTLDQLRRWNPSINMDRLRIGQTLHVYVEGRRGAGDGGAAGSADVAGDGRAPRAVGQPHAGRLVNGQLLPDGAGYRVRNRAHSWGMPVTIEALRSGFARTRTHFVDAPDVLIGDLSRQAGGRFQPHSSHQNGLDADVAYYQVGETELCRMETISPEQLDVERQWYLFHGWLREGIVEYIFVEYPLQEPLYAWAAARGATEAELATWFQFPRGRSASAGIIRHHAGHANHFHVRFIDR